MTSFSTTPRPKNPPYRMISVDDHEIVHAGVARMAEKHGDFVLLDSVLRRAEVDAAVRRHNPDLVLLDLFLGDDQTWDVCDALTRSYPDLLVVFYSGFGNPQLISRALGVGAHGYLLKSTRLDDIASMLRKVVTLGRYIDPELASATAIAVATSDQLFSERELDIIRLIADGYDNYRIADELHISSHTVKFHIGKALRRSGETNRAGLARLAQELHLLYRPADHV